MEKGHEYELARPHQVWKPSVTEFPEVLDLIIMYDLRLWVSGKANLSTIGQEKN